MKNFERQKNMKFLYNVYGCIIKNRCSPGSSRMVISYLFEMLRIHECALKMCSTSTYLRTCSQSHKQTPRVTDRGECVFGDKQMCTKKRT